MPPESTVAPVKLQVPLNCSVPEPFLVRPCVPASVALMTTVWLVTVMVGEPEETAKLNVVEVLETLLPSYPANVAVQVLANGSQYAPDHRHPTEVVNSFNLEIKPLYGFVE